MDDQEGKDGMITVVDISGLSLGAKLKKIIRMALDASKDPQIRAIAKGLGTPEAIYAYVKNRVKYKREAKDTLYHPLVTLQRQQADCEDLTATISSMALALGYPVRFIIIANGTRHIYPLIWEHNQWRRFDATPKSAIIPGGYTVRYDVEVHPNGETISRKATSEEISDVSGLSGTGHWIEIPLDAKVKPGDLISFHLVPKWYLPTWLEEWIYKQIISHTHPDWKIVNVTKPTKDYHRYIVQVKVLGDEGPIEALGSVTLVVGIIAATILGGGLLTYLSISKVEKFVPSSAISMGSLGFATIGAALLLANLAKFVPAKKEKKR